MGGGVTKVSAVDAAGVRAAKSPTFCYVVCMRLVINGEERSFSAATLDALIEELGMKADRVAVELNGKIVSRASWSATALQDGHKLEIVHFVGGGKT